ncbi:MAG: DUF1501 domain-containing protein [Candidatus Omnitrophica bacterium]|nr:DUF1501 domain-containing protein [Candidatus Omnitrophota bacterium]
MKKITITGVFIISFVSSLLLYGEPSTIRPRAKAVIQIWLWGGPSHLDTFDPKPNAGYDYCGPFDKTIPTNVPGIEINAMLPNLAGLADKYSIIRSMTHGINSHETAAYIMQTGHPSEERTVYPGVGAVVSLFKGYDYGYKGVIPPYVILTESQGRFSEVGFLGSRYKPFITGGDPNKQPFAVEGIILEGISEQRQRYRTELLEGIDTLERYIPENEEFIRFNKSRQQAWAMIEEGKKLFDLSQEPDELRERYGKNTFGQSCLVARRLVENGVVYVTINYKGWDTHSQHFQAMRQKLPEFDKGLSALIQDLSERGLLDTTIVWVSGEFGRTPKISWEPPWNGGRGHYGSCFSFLVAGGGFKGGYVVGSSDEKGEYVKERPVYPQDLLGSIYYLLGIDPDGIFPDEQGRNLKILPPIEKGEGKGLLWEIMNIKK